MLEGNPMNVKHVGKRLDVPVIFEYVKELILERSPMNVDTVVMPSFSHNHSKT